jgi:hypothetical protein
MITDWLGAAQALAEICGGNWQIAAAAAFVAMTFESTDPVPAEEAKRGPLQNVAMLVGLVTPFLLFLHGFWSVGVAQMGVQPEDLGGVFQGVIASPFLLVLVAVMAFVTLFPAVLGWVIRKISPPLARLTTALAPLLTIAVFVFTVYVTQRSAIDVINLALGRLG